MEDSMLAWMQEDEDLENRYDALAAQGGPEE
jgi:hypothetical protein